MIHLALWVAAALFLLVVGLVALSLATGAMGWALNPIFDRLFRRGLRNYERETERRYGGDKTAPPPKGS